MNNSPASDGHYLLNIVEDRCPMTFVKTRLQLDRMPPGSELEVHLKGAEPLNNVPRSARELGYEVSDAEEIGDGVSRIFIRKP